MVSPDDTLGETHHPCHWQANSEGIPQPSAITHNVRLKHESVAPRTPENKLCIEITEQLAITVVDLRFDVLQCIDFGVVMPEVLRFQVLPQEILHCVVADVQFADLHLQLSVGIILPPRLSA